jgi:hypothetical protein
MNRIITGPSGGGSGGAPLKYRLVYTPPVGAAKSSFATKVGHRP